MSGRALITGASAGLGAALAEEFASHGHDLVLVARRADRLARRAAELEDAHGVAATPIAMDLTDEGAPARLFDELDDRGLGLGTLVNNAGMGTYGPFAESDPDEERAQIDLNVRAVVELSRRFLRDRERGKLLNVGSVAGVTPGPYLAGYYASKAYVNSFTQAVAAEHGDRAVDVTLLAPGPIATEFHERAGMDHSSVGDRLCYDADRVAEAGYEGLQSGETVVVPGLGMKLLVALLRVTPRSLQRWGALLVNRGR